MKRVRCPKCDQYITFDETKYTAGQSLVFKCPDCGKEFGIRIGVSKLRERQKDENPDEQANEQGCGSIVVIENVFHYKQVIPLQMGDNVIGRYQKGNPANATFETVDPSVDLNHCTITVSRDKKGRLRYTLKDIVAVGDELRGVFGRKQTDAASLVPVRRFHFIQQGPGRRLVRFQNARDLRDQHGLARHEQQAFRDRCQFSVHQSSTSSI